MATRHEPIALISDIHGNLEALRAVMDDIAAQGIATIINMGDVVGYGPNPEACIDIIAERCAINLCGNHDYAVLHDAEGFNPVAKAAVDFVRARMEPKEGEADPDKARRWAFLQDLEPIYEGEGFEAMHASPRQPITEYILPSDPEMDPYKLENIFGAMNRPLAFVGHTHFPGVIEESSDYFIMPQTFEGGYRLNGRTAIVNVGSVGQPRDRDVRSCYVAFDGERVTWRRVAYDIESTVRKVNESGGLHEICGLRLREGR